MTKKKIKEIIANNLTKIEQSLAVLENPRCRSLKGRAQARTTVTNYLRSLERQLSQFELDIKEEEYERAQKQITDFKDRLGRIPKLSRTEVQEQGVKLISIRNTLYRPKSKELKLQASISIQPAP